MEEYCVMKNGTNIECFETYLGALVLVSAGYGDKILLVKYDDDENEIGCECVWEREE